LPPQISEQNLRKISGSKHVISAHVDVDNLSGSCKGSGRIQIRLNNGESADKVKLNFLRLGYQVNDFVRVNEKKSIITEIKPRDVKEITDPSAEKYSELIG